MNDAITAPPPPLRPATVADAAALALIGAATFLEAYAGLLPGPDLVAHCDQHHSQLAWRGLLSAPGSACWIAEARLGAPVAYCLLTAPDLPGGGAGDMEIRRIYVLSAYRRAGLGAAMMRVAEREAGSAGARRLMLGVWGQNFAAHAFYRQLGFEVVGTRLFSVGSQMCDDLVFARPIEA